MADILELHVIGIIRRSFRTARENGNIDAETGRACENLIDKLQKLDELVLQIEKKDTFGQRKNKG